MVSNTMGSKGIEIPLCPSHGVLHVKTLKNVFKDATGLKYRNPSTGRDRVILYVLFFAAKLHRKGTYD